jgi:hypothetical protein
MYFCFTCLFSRSSCLPDMTSGKTSNERSMVLQDAHVHQQPADAVARGAADLTASPLVDADASDADTDRMGDGPAGSAAEVAPRSIQA